MNKRNLLKTLVITFLTVLFVIIPTNKTYAKKLDEIIDYSMSVEIQDSGYAVIVYDIQWKVLDSKSEGPLEWVKIGIPGRNNISYYGITDTISSIDLDYSGGSYVKIYFDRAYYKDEIVHFSFCLEQDGLYEYNPDNGYAVYTFTPGWFDGIDVDNLTIYWKDELVESVSPACMQSDGYYVWNTSLGSGEKYTVTVKYPGDAYAFTVYEEPEDNSYKYSEHSLIANIGFTIVVILCCVFMIAVCALPVAMPVLIIYLIYRNLSGFTIAKDKKIERTIIEYYESCPNCGGTRAENDDKCQYCGSSMIKSKEVITEEDIAKKPEFQKYATDGLFKYSDDPNKFVRVHVVSAPHIVRSTSNNGARSSSTNRGSSGRSHSSCAHSSCACACACACAGGGRAGCSTKDFYNTNLKLKSLKNKLRK